MGIAFIEKNYNSRFLSAQGYIDEFYGNRTNISQTEYISTPYISKTIDYLFSGFTAMTYIDLPNCTSLAYKTFYGCSKLKSMYLPNVEYVKSNAFEKCSSLKNITLSKCIYMEDSIFDDCNSLEEINLPILSSISTGICIQNLSNLESINMPMISGGIILKNLQTLGTLNLYNLEYIGDIPRSESLPTYFENLPDIAFIELSNVKAVGQSAFRSLPILNSISLQTCSIIYSNVFAEDSSEYSLPGSVQFSLPSVKSFDFVSNAIFSSITLPAVTNFSTFYTTPLYQTNVYPYYIGLPNVSQINGPVNLFDFVGQTSSTTFTHDLIIDLPSLTEIGSSVFSVGGGYSYVGSNGVIFNTPNLLTIGSYGFYRLKCIKEIDLTNVSVLEEFVFADTYDVNNLSYSYIKFRNSNNIREIKKGALHNTKLSTSGISLPNCTSFDFRQDGTLAEYGIAGYDISTIKPEISYYSMITVLDLPSLSEIVIDPNDGFTNFAPMRIFPTERFQLSNCERIIFNDGSSFYADGTISELYGRRCNLLSIPKCSIFKYIYNSSINSDHHNVLINVRSVYAPRLSSFENILFRDVEILNCSQMALSFLNLEYTAGNVSNISFNHSFSGTISFANYSNYSSYAGMEVLLQINLPNFSGDFDFMPYASRYWRFNTNYIFNLVLGNTNKTRINLAQINEIFSRQNIRLRKTFIDNDTTLVNINPGLLNNIIPYYPSMSFYIQECTNVYYETWSSSMVLHQSSVEYKGLSNIGYTLSKYCASIFQLGGCVYADNLETAEFSISYASLVNSSYLSTAQYNYINNCISLPYMNELYAPKFSDIHVKVPYELSSNMLSIRPYLSMPAMRKLQLGFSTLDTLAFKSYHASVSDYRLEPISGYNITYFSMSNVETIPLANGITLNLPNATTVNLDSLTNIYGGLSIPKVSSGINFISKLSTINLLNIQGFMESSINFENLLGFSSIVLNSNIVESLSIPKVTGLPTNAFYSLSKVTRLILSSCLYIGMNALPMNISEVYLCSSYVEQFINPLNFMGTMYASSSILRVFYVPNYALFEQYYYYAPYWSYCEETFNWCLRVGTF